MTGARIAVKAVAVCRDGERVLVERGEDRTTGRRFYRPIGGSVEPGERAAEAAAREWVEEYGVAIEDLRLLGVLENLFTFEGRAGHEIVFVFAARPADPEAARAPELVSVDTDGLRHEAAWVALDELESGGAPLYPEGLLPLLRGDG